jgi:hypothetical protein
LVIFSVASAVPPWFNSSNISLAILGGSNQNDVAALRS